MRVDQIAQSKEIDEAMDQHAIRLIVAFEKWRRQKRRDGKSSELYGLLPEQTCELFIKEISG